jgi:hypothetical protein
MKNANDYYKNVLLDGCSIEYKKLSICDLRDYYDFYSRRKTPIYQVHCHDSKHRFSKIYDNVGDAINRFVELKKKLS